VDKHVSGEEETSQPSVHKGHERILVVDDEAINIDVISTMLMQLGYDILSTTNGREAIELYRKEGFSIDLVIIDVIMPGLSGQEILSALKAINPHVKVILTSGYNLDALVSSSLSEGICDFLQKPFRIEDIAQKVRQVLDERSA